MVNDNLFLKLIRFVFAGGAFDDVLDQDDWTRMYEMAKKQSLLGVLSPALDELQVPLAVYARWQLNVEKIVESNVRIAECTKELKAFFEGAGLNYCVLKGQGTARFYPDPCIRQSGDIDVWVDAPMDKILASLRSSGIGIGEVIYHHCDAKFFKDVDVEVHFHPSFMFDAILNKRLQKWLKEYVSFGVEDEKLGYPVPDVKFATLHCTVHIFRHLFHEGIGLRQLLDLYYLLKNIGKEDRDEVFSVMKKLSLGRFAAALMWVLGEVFGLEEQYYLCPQNERLGRKLMGEILRAGNFGMYDERLQSVRNSSTMKYSMTKMKRLLPLFSFCPREVLASPFYKLWQYSWRKRNNYL